MNRRLISIASAPQTHATDDHADNFPCPVGPTALVGVGGDFAARGGRGRVKEAAMQLTSCAHGSDRLVGNRDKTSRGTFMRYRCLDCGATGARRVVDIRPDDFLSHRHRRDAFEAHVPH